MLPSSRLRALWKRGTSSWAPLFSQSALMTASKGTSECTKALSTPAFTLPSSCLKVGAPASAPRVRV